MTKRSPFRRVKLRDGRLVDIRDPTPEESLEMERNYHEGIARMPLAPCWYEPSNPESLIAMDEKKERDWKDDLPRLAEQACNQHRDAIVSSLQSVETECNLSVVIETTIYQHSKDAIDPLKLVASYRNGMFINGSGKP